MPILPSTPSDIPQLLPLINSAFRGDNARQGWTHEADLIQGTQRTDESTLCAMMQIADAVLLKYCNDAGDIEGCVYLHKKERGLYLGMLTVEPGLQGSGIGKKLLAAAEEYAREQGMQYIYMTVFSVREELIDWYERHGYRRTGETKPYEVNPEFGVPTRPLEFVVLEKAVRE
ncbi:MAG TPA: GNAT family N-acetyltransferase [Saprospiraceae bacterium]|nr:GNAT family N-acetyltransferase [Saprospiraceae bacterium]